MSKAVLEILMILIITTLIYATGFYFENTALGLFSIVAAWLLIWGFMRKNKKSWKELGFKKPHSWPRTWLVALTGAAGIHFIIGKLLKPQITKVTGPLDISEFASIPGNPAALALGLLVVWTLAAFGEEMVFRGYFLNRLAGLFKRRHFAWTFAILISSCIFGFGHIYQGFAGVILAFAAGILYCLAYFFNLRNLWAPILMHGIYDTFAFLILFFGLEI